MVDYNYSNTIDFPNGIIAGQLFIEIEKDTNITKTLINVQDEVGDNVKITFANSLTTGEETTLNTLVSNHIPYNSTSFFKINSTNKTFIKTTSYNVALSHTIFGENSFSIKSIKVLSRISTDGASYSVRIYDATNKNVIAENTFSNTSLIINDMGTLNNLPSSESIIEVQAKRIGGKTNSRVYIPECTIEYVE
jgi:hypothetical protein